MNKVDIYTKGEIISYLQELLKEGQIKDCKHIKIEKGYANAFYPKCDVDMASRITATNVDLDITGYGGPSSYHWPKCPKDCLLYNKANDFFKSLTKNSEEKPEKLDHDSYIVKDRIEELRNLPKKKFDATKLVKLCEELNQNYKFRNYFSVGAVLRTILHHIPPIFDSDNFEQVASNYSWGKSHKSQIMRLNKCSIDIGNNLLHTQIKKIEVLPKRQRVNFKAELDILLAEIITILKS